jgi:hypothetical protein
MANNDRKMILAVTSSSFDIENNSLIEIKERVEKLIEQYGEDACVEKTSFRYDDGEYLYVFQNRLENDEEYKLRIEQEDKVKKMNEERDSAEFIRLSKKYS